MVFYLCAATPSESPTISPTSFTTFPWPVFTNLEQRFHIMSVPYRFSQGCCHQLVTASWLFGRMTSRSGTFTTIHIYPIYRDRLVTNKIRWLARPPACRGYQVDQRDIPKLLTSHAKDFERTRNSYGNEAKRLHFEYLYVYPPKKEASRLKSVSIRFFSDAR